MYLRVYYLPTALKSYLSQQLVIGFQIGAFITMMTISSCTQIQLFVAASGLRLLPAPSRHASHPQMSTFPYMSVADCRVLLQY